VATVAPGITDDLEIAVAASLLGSIAVKDIDIDAAISIDATTTVDADALIGNTAVASVTSPAALDGDGYLWSPTACPRADHRQRRHCRCTTDLTVGQSAGVTGTVLIGGNGTLSTGGFSASPRRQRHRHRHRRRSGALWTMTANSRSATSHAR